MYNMPAKSKSQKRLMSMALAYKKGKLENIKGDKNLLDKLKSISNYMSEEELRKYINTPEQNLPDIKESIAQIIKQRLGKRTLELAIQYKKGNLDVSKYSKSTLKKVKDLAYNNTLVDLYKGVEEIEKSKKIKKENVNLDNVPGMGNVELPNGDIKGSGDIPTTKKNKFKYMKKFKEFINESTNKNDIEKIIFAILEDNEPNMMFGTFIDNIHRNGMSEAIDTLNVLNSGGSGPSYDGPINKNVIDAIGKWFNKYGVNINRIGKDIEAYYAEAIEYPEDYYIDIDALLNKYKFYVRLDNASQWEQGEYIFFNKDFAGLKKLRLMYKKTATKPIEKFKEKNLAR